MLETTSDSKSGPEFVEKFFTERELHVLDEKSGTGEVDKDRFDEWFREVEKTFKKLPLYQDSAWEKLKVVINFYTINFLVKMMIQMKRIKHHKN